MVADAEGLDPPLLPERQRDEEAELHQFGHREVAVQLIPQRVVRDAGVPNDGAGIGQGRPLARCEAVGFVEVEEFIVLGFGEPLPSSLDGPLDPSVFAVDRFGNVDPAELFERVVQNAVAER